jgi:hypothetical protein
LQQFVGIAEPTGELVNQHDHLFQLTALLAQSLRTLGLIPDIGLFELALYLGETFRLALVVKDTPSTQQCVH